MKVLRGHRFSDNISRPVLLPAPTAHTDTRPVHYPPRARTSARPRLSSPSDEPSRAKNVVFAPSPPTPRLRPHSQAPVHRACGQLRDRWCGFAGGFHRPAAVRREPRAPSRRAERGSKGVLPPPARLSHSHLSHPLAPQATRRRPPRRSPWRRAGQLALPALPARTTSSSPVRDPKRGRAPQQQKNPQDTPFSLSSPPHLDTHTLPRTSPPRRHHGPRRARQAEPGRLLPVELRGRPDRHRRRPRRARPGAGAGEEGEHC